VQYEDRENPSFDEESVGTGLFVTKDWDDIQSTTVGYQFKHSKVTNDDDDDEDDEDLDLSWFLVSHSYDTREPFFLPVSGVSVEGSQEWGDDLYGSSLNFLRTTLSLAWFKELREGTVFATSLRGGVIVPVGDDDRIPIQERFFNGGENTVRSYKQDELGPEDSDGDPRGGEAFKVANVELRQRIDETNFGVTAFFDIGDVHRQAENVLDVGDVGTAVGGGLMYVLPIGPLRLDFGWNPDPSEGEDDLVIHFALGFAF